ncbi:hypothetical protein D6D28_07915 [Aureobasidium pullulans]|uniref:Mitochondrial outer membrane transport complex Sam37/metaxin N-terminal domain-containing protein n=1 Tax=Aureobasidium pullulans TaxID=5580 RepID=A0A4S8S9D9_AURPU|nr:hypothetical protein D6D28_07915 [Aureobasidium pullulans]
MHKTLIIMIATKVSKMKLHILGPAFGLPSIDAECIAAVALVERYTQGSGQAWALVASHEAATGTQLPFLQVGDKTYSGFDRIAQHLVEVSGGTVPGLATNLTAEQQADATALSTFIKSEGQLLLDISLYVSFENYRNRTRSAFTKILPWYANFVIPPQRRDEARQRTQNLGVSSVDVDDIHEDVIDKPSSMQSEQQKKPFEHETEKHARRLLGRRDTVRTLLQQPEHAAAFRLNALADNFFEPLQDLLKKQSTLLGTEEPAIVDCLAFGYLSLMFYPKMPQNWLASTMRLKYQKLVVYIGSLRDTLRIDAHPDEALSAVSQSEKGAAELPWVTPQSFSPFAVISYIGQSLFNQLPLPKSNAGLKQLPTNRQPSLLQRYLPAVLGLTSTSLALLGFWAYNNLTWPHGEAVHFFGRRKFVDYGAAGATLSALGSLGMHMQQQHQQSQSPVQVDVTVDEQVLP